MTRLILSKNNVVLAKQADGTMAVMPQYDAAEREEDARMYAWYLITEQEFNALSADAQHRLIDRYHEAQNLLADRDVEQAMKLAGTLTLQHKYTEVALRHSLPGPNGSRLFTADSLAAYSKAIGAMQTIFSAKQPPAKKVRYQAEYTDTFGGEANYSWVTREFFDLPESASDRDIVKAGKAAVGLTGVKCDTENHGDAFVVRPRGTCTVLFITCLE